MSDTDMTLSEIVRSCRTDSKRWFPNTADNLIHHSLGMGGEAGEFLNLLKKVHRGSLDFQDAQTKWLLACELVDVLIYVGNIAGILKIDLTKVYQTVRATNEKRFNRGKIDGVADAAPARIG